jgi:hypothetical protein
MHLRTILFQENPTGDPTEIPGYPIIEVQTSPAFRIPDGYALAWVMIGRLHSGNCPIWALGFLQLFGCATSRIFAYMSQMILSSTRGCIGIHSDLLGPFGVPSVTLCDAGKFSVAQSPTLVLACWEKWVSLKERKKVRARGVHDGATSRHKQARATRRFR